MKTKLYLLLATAALLAFSSISAWAEHPAYLHALSDLRQARAYLIDGPHGGRLDGAIKQINAAINDLKEASVDDGRNLDYAPPIDTGLGGGRLRRALELLGKAHDDIYREEDNDWARRLRSHAGGHIEGAKQLITQFISNNL